MTTDVDHFIRGIDELTGRAVAALGPYEGDPLDHVLRYERHLEREHLTERLEAVSLDVMLKKSSQADPGFQC